MLEFVPNFFMQFKNELEELIDKVFPNVCGICGKINKNYICENCKKRIKKFEKYELINREILNSNLKYSNKIKRNNFKYISYDNKIYFDNIFYCFEYKGVIRNLLLKYKFSGASYLCNFWANVILNNKKINEFFKIYDIIIPVPMDKNKKLKRGYNQTELIANNMDKKLKIQYMSREFYSNEKRINEIKKLKYKNKELIKNTNRLININCGILIKIKQTKTQSKLNFYERQENIKNAFFIKDKEILKNKKVILFDDIYTTGATVNEISRILKMSGVKEILVLVIAKD